MKVARWEGARKYGHNSTILEFYQSQVTIWQGLRRVGVFGELFSAVVKAAWHGIAAGIKVGGNHLLKAGKTSHLSCAIHLGRRGSIQGPGSAAEISRQSASI